ncbi:MAG: hypothetical protein PVF58_12870 [Candidatus Methanofastidiosia archaeon]|jgi:hypothetical protein
MNAFRKPFETILTNMKKVVSIFEDIDNSLLVTNENRDVINLVKHCKSYTPRKIMYENRSIFGEYHKKEDCIIIGRKGLFDIDTYLHELVHRTLNQKYKEVSTSYKNNCFIEGIVHLITREILLSLKKEYLSYFRKEKKRLHHIITNSEYLLEYFRKCYPLTFKKFTMGNLSSSSIVGLILERCLNIKEAKIIVNNARYPTDSEQEAMHLMKEFNADDFITKNISCHGSYVERDYNGRVHPENFSIYVPESICDK